MELTDLTISHAQTLLRAGELSADELTAACLQAIERLNPLLNAFITVGEANQEARKQGNMAGPMGTCLPVYLFTLLLFPFSASHRHQRPV